MVAGYFRALSVDGLTPFSSGLLSSIGWPEGVPNPADTNLASPLSIAVTWLFGLIFGVLGGQLALAVVGLWLTAFTGGWVAWQWTRSWVPTVFGLLALGVTPMTLHWSSALPALAHTWLLVLVLFFSLRLMTDPAGRRWPLSVAFVVCVLWHPYFAAFAGLGVLSVLVWALAYRRVFLRSAAIAVLPGVLVAGAGVILARTRSLGLSGRTPEAASDLGLFRYSLTSKEFSSLAVDGRAYMSLIVVVLASIAIIFGVLRWREKESPFQARVGALVLLLGLSAVAFSGGSIMGVPSARPLLLRFMPELRQGWYALILLQCALVLLAILGLHAALQHAKARWAMGPRLAATLGVGLVVGQAALAETPDGRWMTRVPSTLHSVPAWVSSLPPGPVLVLPWEVGDRDAPFHPAAYSCLMLASRSHPLVNECDVWRTDQTTRLIDRLRASGPCERVNDAMTAGVRYFLAVGLPPGSGVEACLGSAVRRGRITRVPTPGHVVGPDAAYVQLWAVSRGYGSISRRASS